MTVGRCKICLDDFPLPSLSSNGGEEGEEKLMVGGEEGREDMKLLCPCKCKGFFLSFFLPSSPLLSFD